jgi:HEPN domain-containing protein
MKSGRDLGRDLMEKAGHDLTIASIGLDHGAPLDTVCFHLQQAVEKILKACLSLAGVKYPLTHDLDVLFDLAEPYFEWLSMFRDRFEGFTPYAVELRYSLEVHPVHEEAAAGLADAREFQRQVTQLLPELA